MQQLVFGAGAGSAPITLQVSGIPSFVTAADFTRLLTVDGCLSARLLGRCG